MTSGRSPPTHHGLDQADSAGERHRGISYEADFEYREGETLIVEDVKGFETQVFKLKKKLLLHRYPGLVFRQMNVKEKQ